jgi:hypothetical protein
MKTIDLTAGWGRLHARSWSACVERAVTTAKCL